MCAKTTAAPRRRQANTARLPADNPVPARIKELEAPTDVFAGAKTTFVFGQGDVGEQV